MSTLEELLKQFILDHQKYFTAEDNKVLRIVLTRMRDNKFRAALDKFQAHIKFLGFDFDQASEIISKLHEKISEVALATSEPTGAAALAAFGADDNASFKQHVSPESSVVSAPKNKRQLSVNSKKLEQPDKKRRAAPRCGKCGQKGHTARSKKCSQNCGDASGGGAAKSKTTRKKSAFNVFTAGGGKRKDWESVSPEEKAHYQALADEANVSKRAPVVEKPKEESKEASSEPASATAAKELKDLPEPIEAPPPVPEPIEAPPPVPEPVTPRQEPQLPGEESSDDEEYVEEEDRDRKNTPYLNVRDVIKVTLSEAASALAEAEAAPRGKKKEFNKVKKIDAFLKKAKVRTEETKSQASESKEDVVSYSPEEDNQFYVASEVEVDDEGVLEEIELGLHKDGTEDEYKFKHKMTVPTSFIEWEVVSRADQSVVVTEGPEDRTWRAVLDCLHTYGGEGRPFGVPLVDADGEPLLDDRGQQRYNDIENIYALLGGADDTGLVQKLKQVAGGGKHGSRKAYTDKLEARGIRWEKKKPAKKFPDGVVVTTDAAGTRVEIPLSEFAPPLDLVDDQLKCYGARKVYTNQLEAVGIHYETRRGKDGVVVTTGEDGTQVETPLSEYVPPDALTDVRQKWLNKKSLSTGPTNYEGEEPRYVFDPNWRRPAEGVVRTEEEKDKDADQIHIRTWALRVGMELMPAVEYKIEKDTGLPALEYDPDDEKKEHPARVVVEAGRLLIVQWGDEEYDAVVVGNDPEADPPLLRCEYTRPSVQVGEWTMTKVHHGNEFRYVVEGPDSAGEAKEDTFELGKPETLERVQTFFAAHGHDDVQDISTAEGANWGPFDLNFEEDTFKKMGLYDGDHVTSIRKEAADLLADDASALAEVKSLTVQEAQEGDTPEDDDLYLNNVVIFKGREYDIEERKFEGGTYLYNVADQWVPQDELEIKPPEEIRFEEDDNRHHGGGGGETKSVDEAEEELDPNAVYIYTDEEGAQHRVKIVTEEYGYGIEDPPKPAPDLAWYWARRNEQVEAVKRQEAIKRAEFRRPEEVYYDKWEIRRARLVIDGHRVEGGYDVFKDDVLVATVGNIEELKVKLQELDGDEVEAEDISNIEALWAINEAEVEKYISASMTTTGSDKSKKDFANGYGGLVDVVDETGKQYERVILAHLEKVSTIEEEAAAARAKALEDAARVAEEDVANERAAEEDAALEEKKDEEDSSSDGVTSSDDESDEEEEAGGGAA